MAREEQDKLWAELSEESKNRIISQYNAHKKFRDTTTLDSAREDATSRIDEFHHLFGPHNLKPPLTYEDVAKELFKGGAWQVSNTSELIFQAMAGYDYPFNFASVQQLNKIIAINKLLNVAKFLNKNEDGSDWVPDFKNKDEKYNKIWSLGIDEDDGEIMPYIVDFYNVRSEIVYFRTKEIANQAVQILGEDTIRTALTTKY